MVLVQDAFGLESRKGDDTVTDHEKLQMLFDRMQIGEVIHRYPVSIDSRDWKLFRSIFTDEIQVYLDPRPTSPTSHLAANQGGDADRGLADLGAELEQLAVDPGRAQERIGAAHLTNQLTNFALH